MSKFFAVVDEAASREGTPFSATFSSKSRKKNTSQTNDTVSPTFQNVRPPEEEANRDRGNSTASD